MEKAGLRMYQTKGSISLSVFPSKQAPTAAAEGAAQRVSFKPSFPFSFSFAFSPSCVDVEHQTQTTESKVEMVRKPEALTENMREF